jgi:hypothetical protein
MLQNSKNRGEKMKIALVGPSELSAFDKKDIHNYIDAIAQEHEIALLAYRSIEIEVFKYFVNNTELASQLHVYAFQTLPNMPEALRTSIEFLVSKGATFHSFNHEEILVNRQTYVNAWRDIVDVSDLVVSFYDSKKTTLMIPIDEAKSKKKKGLVYYLPGLNEDKFKQAADKKMRFV